MSLFSDVDWFIILIVGGILLLGGNNKELLRTAGRMYAKVIRLRDEFLKDLRESANETPRTTTPAAASPGVWAVGTTRTVPPLPREESDASIARMSGGLLAVDPAPPKEVPSA